MLPRRVDYCYLARDDPPGSAGRPRAREHNDRRVRGPRLAGRGPVRARSAMAPPIGSPNWRRIPAARRPPRTRRSPACPQRRWRRCARMLSSSRRSCRTTMRRFRIASPRSPPGPAVSSTASARAPRSRRSRRPATSANSCATSPTSRAPSSSRAASADAGEGDFVELVEFVRAGAQLTFDELAGARADAPG